MQSQGLLVQTTSPIMPWSMSQSSGGRGQRWWDTSAAWTDINRRGLTGQHLGDYLACLWLTNNFLIVVFNNFVAQHHLEKDISQFLDTLVQWCAGRSTDAWSATGGPINSINDFIMEKLLTCSSHMKPSIVHQRQPGCCCTSIQSNSWRQGVILGDEQRLNWWEWKAADSADHSRVTTFWLPHSRTLKRTQICTFLFLRHAIHCILESTLEMCFFFQKITA